MYVLAVSSIIGVPLGIWLYRQMARDGSADALHVFLDRFFGRGNERD